MRYIIKQAMADLPWLSYLSIFSGISKKTDKSFERQGILGLLS